MQAAPTEIRAERGAHVSRRAQVASARARHEARRGDCARQSTTGAGSAAQETRRSARRKRATWWTIAWYFSVVHALAVALFALAPTTGGPTGLLHTPAAVPDERGTVRAALYVDWFRASRFLTPTDEHAHSGGTAVIGASLVRGLDAYFVGRAYTNNNSEAKTLYEVFGDTTLGARYARAFGALGLGGASEVLVGNAPGSVGLAGRGTSFRLRALSSYAFKSARLHLGLAYLFDNTSALVTEVESARGSELTVLERYGLGINKVDRFEASLGVELLTGAVAPFVELGVGVPVNRQRVRCTSGCGAVPSKVTVGARATYRGVSLLLGLDVGTSGVTRAPSSIAPQAPYTLWLGFALALDTREHPRTVVVERVEVAPPVVPVRGFVHHGSTPIVEAKVSFVGAARAPLMTGEDGYFGAELPPGTYEFRVRAAGYQENTCGGTAIAVKGNVLTIDCPLEPTQAVQPLDSPSPGE